MITRNGSRMHRSLVITIAADPAAMTVVRKATRCIVGEWAPGGTAADTAELIVCELTSNACRETPGRDIKIRVKQAEDLVELAVWDESPTLPGPPTAPDLTAETGRGLWLIEHMSLKTGTDLENGGKWSWSVIETRS